MIQLLVASLLILSPLTQEATERAWQQAEPYRAPDFESFFPDDQEGAQRLDQLIDSNKLRSLEDEEFLQVIRRGLRRTRNHRTSILSWVGNRFIWGKSPQDADAIELCYHASDFSPAARKYGARHYAVYFGLSVVSEKTPSILRTLAELCVEVDDPNDIGRVAWGAADQLDELLPYLSPSLASEEPWEREKAEAVERIFKGELKAFEWAAERALRPARPRPWREMPEVRRSLREGDSAERLAVLARIESEGLGEHMNDSYLADFAIAASDPDPAVRKGIAVFVGGNWIWRAGLHLIADGATDLILKLTRDADHDVRKAAVYYGLSTYRGPREDVLERLVEMALSGDERESHGRLDWALKNHGDRTRTALDALLRGDDLQRAQGAYRLYSRVFEERPDYAPAGIAGPADLVGTWTLELEAPEKRGLQAGAVEIVADPNGALSLATSKLDMPGSGLFEEFVWTELGSTLYFSFELTFEDVVVRTSGRLRRNKITGTTQVGGSPVLYVWSATREKE